MRGGVLVIRRGRILDPSSGVDQVGDLLIRDGRIADLFLSRPAPAVAGAVEIDAAGLVVGPGFIDLHCHLREPGHEDKETIATGTKAAAQGGFTTVCCMGNTDPPLDNAATVQYVVAKAKAEGVVRVLPIGCVTRGREGKELVEMAELAEAGAIGFSDDGSPVGDSRIMRNALSYAGRFGLMVIDHCEDPSLSKGGAMNEGWVSARLGLPGIPAAAEEIMVARDVILAELTGSRVHIAHVSTAGSVEILRRAKEKGIPVTAEVTPHHLTLTEEWVMGREGHPGLAYDTSAKVNPPLRTKKDVQALIQGLKDGVIDVIATDHAPHTAIDKVCEFDQAAFGISNLETALGSLMSLVHKGDLELKTLVARLTEGPARLLGEAGKGLGTLRKGSPANLVLIDPHKTWRVDVNSFTSKGRNSPLHGVEMQGRIAVTIAGGAVVYRDAQGREA